MSGPAETRTGTRAETRTGRVRAFLRTPAGRGVSAVAAALLAWAGLAALGIYALNRALDFEIDPREHLFAAEGPGGAGVRGLSSAVAEAAGVSNVRGYDGGNWNGTIYYVTFDCATLDGCRAAVRELMEVDRYGDRALEPFEGVVPTKFAVNLEGPAFYFDGDPPTPWWDAASVRRGEWYEWNRRDDLMDFYLIDPARNRVFHHHESGGFPDDPPGPEPLRARGD